MPKIKIDEETLKYVSKMLSRRFDYDKSIRSVRRRGLTRITSYHGQGEMPRCHIAVLETSPITQKLHLAMGDFYWARTSEGWKPWENKK